MFHSLPREVIVREVRRCPAAMYLPFEVFLFLLVSASKSFRAFKQSRESNTIFITQAKQRNGETGGHFSDNSLSSGTTGARNASE